MSDLAPTIQAFFTDRLMRERQASTHTITAYRDTMRLLLTFAHERLHKQPSTLTIADLDAPTISAFLDHLQHDRGNTARTRNARLAAIRSLFRFAAYRYPEHAETIQRVLAIPPKRFDRALVTYLTADETRALIDAPDRATWAGRRDHAMLVLAVETGLRISELTNLTPADLHLAAGAHISCLGKGRKHRITPITRTTVTILTQWLAETNPSQTDPLFPSRRRGRLSRDAIERRIAKHATHAARTCTTLPNKNVTAHVLRHTCAMRLLHAGVDTAVIALWLGHESPETTQIYLHADLATKERALNKTKPAATPTGRYSPPDTLLAFLEAL